MTTYETIYALHLWLAKLGLLRPIRRAIEASDCSNRRASLRNVPMFPTCHGREKRSAFMRCKRGRNFGHTQKKPAPRGAMRSLCCINQLNSQGKADVETTTHWCLLTLLSCFTQIALIIQRPFLCNVACASKIQERQFLLWVKAAPDRSFRELSRLEKSVLNSDFLVSKIKS